MPCAGAETAHVGQQRLHAVAQAAGHLAQRLPGPQLTSMYV